MKQAPNTNTSASHEEQTLQAQLGIIKHQLNALQSQLPPLCEQVEAYVNVGAGIGRTVKAIHNTLGAEHELTTGLTILANGFIQLIQSHVDVTENQMGQMEKAIKEAEDLSQAIVVELAKRKAQQEKQNPFTPTLVT